MENRIIVGIADNQARVNVTFAGSNGDLPDPVSVDASDGDIKQWVTEAVRGGGVPGIPASPTANFTDFVIDRFPPNDVRPYTLFGVRPKTPFGDEARRCHNCCRNFPLDTVQCPKCGGRTHRVQA